mmetsp:Transcript_19641/g.45024  ORF Transcript_19641/g.45024 Transcript_19641/m.45024 type:complete len:533 (+) Transcript_19641:351-1949(+)
MAGRPSQREQHPPVARHAGLEALCGALVDAVDGPPRLVEHGAGLVGLLPRLVPLDRLCRGARDRGPPGDRLGGRLGGEELLEDHASVVALLGAGGVVGEPLGADAEHVVINHPRAVLLEPVDPVVANAVRELLLLAEEHLLGEVRCAVGSVAVEGLAHGPLLDELGLLTLVDHLVLAVEEHGRVQKVLVEEGHPSLHAPRHCRLVCAQAVELVKVVELAHALLVQLLAGGRLVEVEVPPKLLVGPLSRDDHLDSERLDLAGQDEHGGPRADRRHVVGLEVVDHVLDGVDSLLHSEVELVVVGAELLGDGARVGQVGRPDEADGEGGGHGAALLLAHLDDDGGDERRVEAPREEHAVGHVGHEALVYRRLKVLLQLGEVEGARGLGGLVPVGEVVPGKLARLGAPVVPGGELLHLVALREEALHLAAEPYPAVGGVAYVHGGDADGVPRGVELVVLLVEDGEGKVAVEVLGALHAHLLVEVDDRLAVGGGLPRGLVLEHRLDLLVVVDLSVDRQALGPAVVEEGLVASQRVQL